MYQTLRNGHPTYEYNFTAKLYAGCRSSSISKSQSLKLIPRVIYAYVQQVLLYMYAGRKTSSLWYTFPHKPAARYFISQQYEQVIAYLCRCSNCPIMCMVYFKRAKRYVSSVIFFCCIKYSPFLVPRII